MTLRFTFWSRKPFGYCPGSSEPDRCTTVTIRTPAGLSGWSAGWESMSGFRFFTTQAKSGSTIVLRMSRWSGKTSSGTVSSVVWSWFQPKLHSGRTQVDPVHGSVSLIGTVGWMNLVWIVQNVLISMRSWFHVLIHGLRHITHRTPNVLLRLSHLAKMTLIHPTQG